MIGDHDDHLIDLLTNDVGWMIGFSYRLGELADNARGQLELWPADDYVAAKMYVACPRRGTHAKIIDCWACWCDCAWGRATAQDVLAPGGDA